MSAGTVPTGEKTMNTTFDILYLSHGGGPRPLLGDPDHAEMVAQFQALEFPLMK